MLFTHFTRSLAVVALFAAWTWIGAGTILAQSSCGSFSFNPTPSIANDPTEPRLSLKARVSGAPSPAPAKVRFEWEVYKDGVFFGSETITDNFAIIGGGFGFAVGDGNIDIDDCGEYYAEVTAIGVDASGNDCFTTATFTTSETCVSQVNDGIKSLACDPIASCPGLYSSRLAAPSSLAITHTATVSSDRLLFETQSAEEIPATLQLLDLQGRTQFKANLTLERGMQAHKFTLPGLASGVYLLTVITNEEQVSEKVIVR